MNKKTILDRVFQQKVTLLFVLLCLGGILASGQPVTFVAGELFTRAARNSFLVLSLIIPVVTGMGLNFGIVIGAMAAQVALFLTTCWGFGGIGGFLLTALLTTPLAALLGWLVGKLFNRIKGSEMIGGLVLGYFADGFYQLLFLFVFGGVIPMGGPNAGRLLLSTGVGVKNTIDLTGTVKYALDAVPMLAIAEAAFYLTAAGAVLSAALRLWKRQPVDWKKTGAVLAGASALYALTFLPAAERFLRGGQVLLLWAVEGAVLAVLLRQGGGLIWRRLARKEPAGWRRPLALCAAALAVYAATYLPAVYEVLVHVRLPVMTWLCIGALCLFNRALMNTRLGQNMRTVGRSRAAAGAAGLDVDRIRVTAMVISTVLAGWGQLIFLQNVGTFSTYGAHTQVGQFAIAALLVGGASVRRAASGQAILGVLLFHTLFIVAPLAGRELFGNAMIGEYFRVFVSFGVIALALAMHAWEKRPRPGAEGEESPAREGEAPA